MNNTNTNTRPTAQDRVNARNAGDAAWDWGMTDQDWQDMRDAVGDRAAAQMQADSQANQR